MDFTLPQIARALGGEVSSGQVIAPGPGHRPHDRSMAVKLGTGDKLLVSSFAGDDQMKCLSYVEGKLGIVWQSDRGAVPQTASIHRMQSRAIANINNGPEFQPVDDGVVRMHQAALRLWNEAGDPRGTIVETYLASRDLVIPDDAAMDVIRFHPSCPFGQGTRHPCMVAAFHSIETGEVVAIHRTALTLDGEKIGRLTLGPMGGAAIKLSRLDPERGSLAVGEGIESTLAGIAMGFGPAWAMGSAGNIAKLPVLPGVDTLTVLAERDGGASANATGQVGMTWSQTGREVLVAMPKPGFGNDANDALQKRSDAGEDVLDVVEFDIEPKGALFVSEVIAEAETIETGTISQDALARIFANRYVDRFRYCHSTGSWFEWSGAHWERDTKARAFDFVRRLGREMTEGSTPREMREVRKVTFAAGVERFAQGDQAFAVSASDWDRDGYLLGTPGGTVDLRTGILRQSDPRDGITKLTSVTPADRADCPRWLQFLDETTGSDAGLIRFLQQWGG